MSFFGLSVFQVPTALIGRKQTVQTMQIPLNPLVYIQHIPTNKYVGCMIITNSTSGYGYDILMPRLAGKNSYGIFSGKVGGSYSDYDCTQTLLRSINFNLPYSAQFIEFDDPATGTPYKVYIMYIRNVNLPRLNSSIRGSITSNDFSYFTRFPTSLISQYQSMQCLKDDSGIDHFLDSTASTLLSRVVPNIGKYI
jgi:hypothetical protein